MDNIDCIYYINLECRPKRKQHIEDELEKLNVPVGKWKYLSAVHRPDNGALGCTESHINVLEDMRQNGHKICIVLEDDAQWTGAYKHNSLDKLLKNIFSSIKKMKMLWNVVFLGGKSTNVEKIQPNFFRVLNCVHTHSYMIHKRALPKVLKVFSKSKKLLEQYGYAHCRTLDSQWTKLQKESKAFFLINPIAFAQRPGYSDIEKKYHNRYGIKK